MHALKIVIWLLGSASPIIVIATAWLFARRVQRLGWLVILVSVVLSLPLGMLIVSLAVGPPPPPDLEDSVISSGAAWGMAILPLLAAWTLAVACSVLIPPLAWLARGLSE
jgi:hypothetical protein